MEPWAEISLFGVTILVMLVGLVGLVIPIFPGIVIIWVAALGYGILGGFSTWGIILFVVLTLLMLLGVTIDNIMMGLGARKGGASWLTIGASMVAGVAGTLLFPPIGGLIAAPAAVLLVEYLRAKDWKLAIDATRGLATGWGLSFLFRFLIGVVMIGLWLIWAWTK